MFYLDVNLANLDFIHVRYFYAFNVPFTVNLISFYFIRSIFFSSPVFCFFFEDINECSIENGGCDHICNNFEGGYFCNCRQGFRLSDDGHRCEGRIRFLFSIEICWFWRSVPRAGSFVCSITSYLISRSLNISRFRKLLHVAGRSVVGLRLATKWLMQCLSVNWS